MCKFVSIDTYIYIVHLNRFVRVSISVIACDREFRMIERRLCAKLEDIRFMSDWNMYYSVGTIALYSI